MGFKLYWVSGNFIIAFFFKTIFKLLIKLDALVYIKIKFVFFFFRKFNFLNFFV